ncbi:hypothetical protein QR680_017273 [Steinernema hermaphroditum]|uniref:Uncharacterized protein n=1 Tax=Steinernema hermaphroditum TaxID=289476 RepID=A0AA39LP26_9BILA|nr:hypothetical protein QR680_017273 [Steinernema hermaphroditum]
MKFRAFLLALIAVAAVAHAKDDIKSALEKTKDTVVDGVSKAADAASGTTSDLADNANDVGGKISDKVAAGIEKKKEALADVKEKLKPNAEKPVAAAAVAVPGTVSCYQCNSASDGEEKCHSSEQSELEPFLKKCPALLEGAFKDREAKGCRKIIQTVGEDTSRTIRECAYTEDPDAEGTGRKRTGNKGISMYYYQCGNESDQKPCNTAVSHFVGLGTIFAAAYIAFF